MNENFTQVNHNHYQEAKTYRARWILPISAVPIEDGIITVKGGKIQSVDKYNSLNNNRPATVTDLGDAIIFPGFINAHTHLEQDEFPEPVNNVFEYLQTSRQRLSSLSDDQRTTIIQRNIDECLKYGTLALADFSSNGLSDNLLARSHLFARVFHEISGFNNFEADSIFNKHFNLINNFLPQKKISKHLAPSSVWSTSKQLLKKIAVNERHIATHMAMTEAETDFMLHGKGQIQQFLLANEEYDYTWEFPHLTPVQYFFYNKFYARHNILVHMNHITEQDIDIIKSSSAKFNICLCPRSNDTLNLENTPVKKIIEKGINICIGTESRTLVSDLDIRKEIIRTVDKYGVSPENAVKFATLNGAYAIGFHKEVGSLDVGKSAKCLVLRIKSDGSGDPYAGILSASGQVEWLGE